MGGGVFAMLGDLTAAQKQLYATATGRRGSLRRRRRTSKRKASTARRARSRSRSASPRRRSGRKLVKGSAAAKRFMARLRAKRKR